MNALVTGATGMLGPRLVESLCQAGHGVRTLSLDDPPIRTFPDGVDARIGDITDASAVKSAMQNIDVAFHLAALLHIDNPSPVLREKYERINVGGTAVVVDAAIQAGVKRLVFFSTIAVYGHSQGEILTEDNPPHPETLYAQTKLAAERIVLDARGSDRQQLGTVLRLGAIYGARIKGNYQRLLQSLHRRRFIPIGKGDNRRTLIYDRDVATAAVLTALHSDAAGRFYNVSDGEFHTLNEIIRTICEALGRTPPRISLPLSPLRFAASILDATRPLVGRRSNVGRAMIDKYSEDLAVESNRIQAQIGFLPQYDLATGWKETVKEMRLRGDL